MNTTDNYPIGAITIFGGTLKENANWLLCDGRELATSDYPELFSTIDYLYGGNPDAKIFNLPNFQGAFLRGASRESNVDPDKINRKRLHPNQKSLSEGVGSFQDFATKNPGPNNFYATITSLPIKSKKGFGGAKDNRTGFNDDTPSKIQNTCQTGGDLETRPKNVYVNYYIKAQ